MAEYPGAMRTKDRILYAAVRMFSDRGYDKVSMRDIAGALGITAPSIYNHFSSKNDLLGSIYDFYAEQQRQLFPDLGEVLRLAETASLPELLSMVDIRYSPPELDEMMNRIVTIAFREVNTSRESEEFIRSSIFDNVNSLLKPLFERMVSLGRLAPFDIDTFLCLFNYFTFASVALYNSPLKLGVENWGACMQLLFQMILPKE